MKTLAKKIGLRTAQVAVTVIAINYSIDHVKAVMKTVKGFDDYIEKKIENLDKEKVSE